MEKPTMVREVGIDCVLENLRIIYVDATPDAISDFTEFGDVNQIAGKNRYHIRVDTRYDFQAVVNYIRNYGSERD